MYSQMTLCPISHTHARTCTHLTITFPQLLHHHPFIITEPLPTFPSLSSPSHNAWQHNNMMIMCKKKKQNNTQTNIVVYQRTAFNIHNISLYPSHASAVYVYTRSCASLHCTHIIYRVFPTHWLHTDGNDVLFFLFWGWRERVMLLKENAVVFYFFFFLRLLVGRLTAVYGWCMKSSIHINLSFTRIHVRYMWYDVHSCCRCNDVSYVWWLVYCFRCVDSMYYACRMSSVLWAWGCVFPMYDGCLSMCMLWVSMYVNCCVSRGPCYVAMRMFVSVFFFLTM